jgi:hypothetical protein
MSADQSARSVSRAQGVDRVRALPRVLYRCAKRDRDRRFHALFDKVARSDVGLRAWGEVRANRGAPGIDGVTIELIERSGVGDFLDGLAAELRAGRYRPRPLRMKLQATCSNAREPRRRDQQHLARYPGECRTNQPFIRRDAHPPRRSECRTHSPTASSRTRGWRDAGPPAPLASSGAFEPGERALGVYAAAPDHGPQRPQVADGVSVDPEVVVAENN